MCTMHGEAIPISGFCLMSSLAAFWPLLAAANSLSHVFSSCRKAFDRSINFSLSSASILKLFGGEFARIRSSGFPIPKCNCGNATLTRSLLKFSADGTIRTATLSLSSFTGPSCPSYSFSSTWTTPQNSIPGLECYRPP